MAADGLIQQASSNFVRLELGAAIASAAMRWSGQPMRWGVDDCALSLSDIYLAVLGRDPAHRFRGRYTTEAEALALMGRKGIVGAWTAAARELGWRLIDPALAATGDLGIVRTPRGCASVIRNGSHWIGRLSCGFTAFPTPRVVMAWSVL